MKIIFCGYFGFLSGKHHLTNCIKDDLELSIVFFSIELIFWRRSWWATASSLQVVDLGWLGGGESRKFRGWIKMTLYIKIINKIILLLN